MLNFVFLFVFPVCAVQFVCVVECLPVENIWIYMKLKTFLVDFMQNGNRWILRTVLYDGIFRCNIDTKVILNEQEKLCPSQYLRVTLIVSERWMGRIKFVKCHVKWIQRIVYCVWFPIWFNINSTLKLDTAIGYIKSDRLHS